MRVLINPQLEEPKSRKFSKQNVWFKGRDRPSSVCFAAYSCKKDPEVCFPLLMYEENADAWLKMLKDNGVPLRSWEFYSNLKKENFVSVLFEGEIPQNFILCYGNLCKGVSEFSWFCETLIQDKSDEPFFAKSRRLYKKFMGNIFYNGAHGWEPEEYMMAFGKEKTPIIHTISECVTKLKRVDPPVGRVWDTLLYRTD